MEKKYYKKGYIIVILLFILGLCGCEQGKSGMEHENRDSLYSVAHIQSIAFSEPERALALLDTAEAKGKLSTFDLNDLRCQVYHNGLSQYKTAYTYARKAYADPDARKDTERYLSLVSIMADECHTNGDYAGSVTYCAEGLNLAKETGNRAAEAELYVTWGLNLLEIKQYDEAFHKIDLAISILESETDKNPCYNTWDGLIHALGMKLALLWDKDRYQEAIAMRPLMEKALRGLEESSDTPKDAADMRRAESDVIYCCIAYATGDTVEAERLYTRVKANPYASTPDGEYIRIPCLLLAKRYDEALHYLEREKRLLQATTDTVNWDYISAHLQMELEAYQGKKDWHAASRVQSSMLALADSLRKKVHDENAQELVEIYKTEDQTRRIERQETSLLIHRIITGFVVGILIVTALFIIRILKYIHTINHKNIAMSNTIDELMTYKKDLLKRQEENLRLHDELQQRMKGKEPTKEENAQTEEITEESPVPEDWNEENEEENYPQTVLSERDRILFGRLVHEITSRKLYLHPDFNKKKLLKEIHVPANKFSSLFKTFAGCSFSQYVQELRMDEAIRLMREHPDWSMDAVAREIQMSNGTFYHQFQKKYGMKPSQYRGNGIISPGKHPSNQTTNNQYIKD